MVIKQKYVYNTILCIIVFKNEKIFKWFGIIKIIN